MTIVRVMECIDWFPFSLFLVALCTIQDLSSPTRDWTHAPCNPALGAQSFNHWATREVLDWFSQSIQATIKEHNTLGDMCTYSLGCVQLFVTPWAVAHQDPLSMGILQARKRVDCYALLQGIFPTQGSDPGLLHCRQILYHLSHQGSPWWHEQQKFISHSSGGCVQGASQHCWLLLRALFWVAGGHFLFVSSLAER